MGDPRTGTPEEQGAEFVDEPFGDAKKRNVPGDQTPPDDVEPEDRSGGEAVAR